MAWVLTALQIALGATFVVSAAGKLMAPVSSAAALRQSGVPGWWAARLTGAVTCVEFAVAAALVLTAGATLRVALAVTLSMLGVFTAWMVWVLARGLRLECACFGSGGTPIGARSIARNLTLAAAAAAAFVLAGWTTTPLPAATVWMVPTVFAGGAALVLLVAVWSVRGHLRLTRAQSSAAPSRS
jgi:hypothetical protein